MKRLLTVLAMVLFSQTTFATIVLNPGDSFYVTSSNVGERVSCRDAYYQPPREFCYIQAGSPYSIVNERGLVIANNSALPTIIQTFGNLTRSGQCPVNRMEYCEIETVKVPANASRAASESYVVKIGRYTVTSHRVWGHARNTIFELKRVGACLEASQY